MSNTSITERLDALIDELLLQGDVQSSSLASMLTAVREAAADGYHVAMARLVWDAHNALRDEYHDEAAPAERADPLAAVLTT